MNFGSITTPIITDGLVFNIDAANRASYVNGNTNTFNTTDFSQSGSLSSPSFTSILPTWDFDGTDDVINTNVTLTDDMSIGGWQKSTYQGASNSFYYPNHTASFRISFGSGYFLGRLEGPYSTQTSLRVKTGGPSNWGSTGTTELNDGNWHYLAYTFEKSSYTTKAYVDGNLESEKSIPSYLSYTNRSINLGNFGSGTNRYWNGSISNVHAYNKTLSASEVLHNYNALKGRFE
mgnify:FL=1|tara:strand:+ start:332 stop:1030 length:699 start_codon:yes stop_codon:yes gene_type:complete